VTVIERGRVGGPQSSSSGNTGFVGTHGASVLAEPGMLGRGLRGLANRAAPVVVRPGPDRDLLRWLRLFGRACRTPPDTGPLVEMKRRSLAMLRELGAAEFTESGMVLAFKTGQAFERALAAVPSAVTRGIPLRALSPAELRELEPDAEFDVHGALYNQEGAFVRVPAFMAGLGETLSARNVDICEETAVTDFAHGSDAVTVVRTSRGDFRPGAVVIAAGAWSARCARLLDVRLDVQPVRGYSVTVQALPSGEPRRPVLLAEGRAAVTPFGSSVRFAGVLEVSGLGHGPSGRRSDGLRRIVGGYLPGLGRASVLETWSGLRPCTPDSLPFLGRAEPYRNVFVAAGHGAMGMGLAPASGLLIAQAVVGEQPDLDLKPFRIGRFG
jgi:D-amino-acid dehydrogenase